MHDVPTLDGFDLRLLAALQQDARLTNQQLGDRIGLSASQCSRRRMRLEAEGVITGYRAELAADRLGFQVRAFITVTLATHSKTNAQSFRALVASVESIGEAYAVTGDSDYLLKATVPDLRSLAALINDTLLMHESVARVRSSIVLERLKETGRLSLSA